MASNLDIAWAWWGLTIVTAIDGDDGCQRQLAEATGVQDAWRTLSHIGPMDQTDWSAFLKKLAADPDEHERVIRNRPHDEILTPAAEYALRIVRGAIRKDPNCLPR